MCLTIDQNRHNKRDFKATIKGRAKEFVADRPLVIKKRVRYKHITAGRKQYRSPYFDTTIRMQKPYECIMSVYDNGHRATVERGFHGYLMSATAIDWQMRPTLTRIDICTIYGVIPTGAKYFIGRGGEVVSSAVMYFESLQDIKDYYDVERLADPHRGGYTDGEG